MTALSFAFWTVFTVIVLLTALYFGWRYWPRSEKRGIPDYPAPPPPPEPEPLPEAFQLSNEQVHEMWLEAKYHGDDNAAAVIDALCSHYPLKASELVQGQIYKHVLNKKPVQVVSENPVVGMYDDTIGCFLTKPIADGELYPSIPEQSPEAQAALRVMQLEFLRENGEVR
jgi:hypothetical protein